MTPMDIFDSMLESIQQFPLECNTYERHCKRLSKDQEKYTKKFEKSAFKLVSPEDKKFIKTKRKLKKIIKEKIRITEKFEEYVNKHLERLHELIKVGNMDPTLLAFGPLQGNGPAIIKIGNIQAGVRKYCICGENAVGMMICCDNPGCLIRWYHFKCVDLNNTPKSGWKCPKCLNLDLPVN